MEFPKPAEPKIEQTTNYLANINDWAAATKDYGYKFGENEFSDQIDENRKLGFQNLEKFDLKRYKSVTLSLSEFLADPEKYLAQMDSEKFYISFIPKKKDLKRKGVAGINRQEVMVLVQDFVAPENKDDYEISVHQFYDNVFGGSVVIGKDGGIYFEFIEGNQTAVGKGNADIKFIVFRDQNLRTFKYSFADEATRKVALDTIMHIPHTGEGRDMEFLPGYYEVAIAKRDEKSDPEPFFIDYRDNEAYQLDWRNTDFSFVNNK